MPNDNTTVRRRGVLRAAGGLGAAGIAGLSGCLGGDDDDDGDDRGPRDDDSDDALDFEGEEIHVMVNAGALAEHQRRNVIPRVEEKYGLVVNDEQAVTGQMIAQIQSNPDDPPDVIDVNVNGLFQAQRNDWLAPMSEYTDIVTNYDSIYDEAKYYDDHGVSWYFGELSPIINTDEWDEIPTSWEEVVERSENIALSPFAWTQGEFLLLISSIVTGEPYDSGDLDVDAGFDWMEEHIAPKHSHTIEGIAQAVQLLTSGDADVLLPAWDIWVADLFFQGTPIRPVRRPDPLSIAAHQAIAVPAGGNVEAGMAYVNELLSLEAQEEHPSIVGTGPTHRDAEIPDEVQEFGAPTIDSVRDGGLQNPNYEYMWENQDEWSERWNQIFAE